MEQDNSVSPINRTKSDFAEFMQRGDDFFKIQLLRQALTWYNKALSLDSEDKKVKSHISECERLIAFENKVVYTLISVASVSILLYLLFIK
ncbi:MAG: hypothetical protein Q7U54_06685 [Bacteroidales bacterium]|nr:hypothetical protein [Bacteroidales bacterium]